MRINSEAAEPVTAADGTVYPFGAGVAEAFHRTLALAEEMRFQTCNVDEYGGHIDWPGSGTPIRNANGRVTGHEPPKVLAIIGHLDVVPAGDGWTYDPYGAEIHDGMLYGRGTTDDKGPLIACLYAMKALKDAGYVPETTVRLIIGLDEETHWHGMEHYFSKVERPDFGFTPDADFPLIHGEKGLLIFRLAKKFAAGRSASPGLRLRTLRGGIAANSVPDSCRAVVRSDAADAYDAIRREAEAFQEETGYRIGCRVMGKSLELTSTGIAAHGAKPEDGLNAVSILMAFLGRLNFVSEEQNDFVRFYNEYIGFCLDGEKLGIASSDEKSGRLVFNVGMVEADEEAGTLTVNIRYPVSDSAQRIFSDMEPALARYDIGWVQDQERLPLYIEMDDPLVDTLLSVYRDRTGDTESQPLVIGGATYARATPGIVAFGGHFPGDEDLMHQRDERLELKRLDDMLHIYAEAIYRLSHGRAGAVETHV